MLAGALLGLLPSPVAGHAIVLESIPAPGAVIARPPERAMLRFNSKIEKRLTRVTLTAGQGPPRPLPVANDDGPDTAEPDRVVVLLGPLAPGPYVIRYKVLSADGHITEGALRFTVSAAP